MGKKKSESKKSSPSFEQALGELEDVVEQLELGNLALDQTLEKYEQGVRLLKVCHKHLGEAERKVQILTSQSEDGDQLEEFDDGATAESSSSSSPRRTSRKKKSASRPEKELDESPQKSDPPENSSSDSAPTTGRRYSDDDDQILLF